MTTLTQGSLLSFPSVHNQITLLRINAQCFPRVLQLTRDENSNQRKVTIEKSLTPVIEKKMSMKNLAEKTIEELVKLVGIESSKVAKDNQNIYIVLPTEESPCIWLEDELIKGELSFYLG